jgi:hypothetical protein
MVDLALSSMALAVYSRTQRHPPAGAEASSRYHRLLRVVQDRIAQLAIQTLEERDIDACLLAVSLMGRYEGATHRPGDLTSKDSFTSLQSWLHHDGAIAILRTWNDNSTQRTASPIIKQTRRELIKSSLLRNLPLPDWMMNGSRFGEHDQELEYDRIFVRIVNLNHASATIRENTDLQILKAKKLNNEARELDNALHDLVAQVPSTCNYRRHVLTKSDPWTRENFYSSIFYSYPRPKYAAAWSQLFAMRMLINSTRLKILEISRVNPLVDLTYEQQRIECIAQLKAMADSLASSIPFCLERFKVENPNSLDCDISITLNTNGEITPCLAGLVAWPLIIASSLEGVDAEQQLWFRSQLARLGRITGDGILECAETDQWATI